MASIPKLVRVKAAGLTVAALAVLAACGSPPTDVAAPPIESPPSATGELTKADTDSWLDGLVPSSMDDGGIAGAAVVVVKDGKILTSRGYGNADTGEGDGKARPVDPSKTLFRVGSVTKLVTDTAAMQLVEAGKMDLDTDINKYLDFKVSQNFDRKITLRHLLTHTAGFEEVIEGMFKTDGESPKLRDVVTIDPPEQIYEPGTVPAYSNYSNALVGYLVEHVSGVPYEKYIEDNIYQRTGMASSTMRQPLPENMADNMSKGYINDSGAAQPFEIVKAFPAGSMSAAPADMAKLMLDQLGEADDDDPLLKPQTRQLMQKPALGSGTLGGLAKGKRMTLGYFDESRNGHRIIGHGGDTNYFHSHLQLYPEERTGIFVTMNSSGNNGTETGDLRQSINTGFADRYFPADDDGKEQKTVPVDTAREHAAIAEGSYGSSRTFRSNFMSAMDLAGRVNIDARDDGTIMVNPSPISTRPVVYEEVEPWLWQEVGGQNTLAMRVKDGEVEAIGLECAFALLPVEGSRDSALNVTILIASVVIMLATLLTPLIAGIIRRYHKLPAKRRAGRPARILTRVAMGCALIALLGWVATIASAAGSTDASAAVIRVVQGLQLLGVLGVIPAGFVLVDTIRQRDWARTFFATLSTLALAGLAWFAVTFMLLSLSITF